MRTGLTPAGRASTNRGPPSNPNPKPPATETLLHEPLRPAAVGSLMRNFQTLSALGFFTLAPVLAAWLFAQLALDDARFSLAVLHAAAGYTWVLATVVLLLALPGAKPARVALALVMLTLSLVRVLPGTLGSTPGGEAQLRLVTANVLMVHPDPDALLEELLAFDADVIVLQEVSPRWAAALEAVEDYPYRVVLPQEDSFGIALLARVPIDAGLEDLHGVAMVRARLDVEGQPVEVWNVHTLPPRNAEYTPVWHAQLQTLAAAAAAHEVPTVLAGDLNATRHHPSHRRLRRAGLRDAHAQLGRAAERSWPNGLFPVPSLKLDHVLVTEEWEAVDARRGRGEGSDHQPLMVDLRLRT